MQTTMKTLLATCLVVAPLAACSASTQDPSNTTDPSFTGTTVDVSSVFTAVSRTALAARLDELTGGSPVTVNGQSFRITERWSPAGKTAFRSYYESYMSQLGLQVNELSFPLTDNLVGEWDGHNVEAVLPGESSDSIVIVTHYDTVGITGEETQNPGADDAGTGIAAQLEAARLFSQMQHRQYTVRFVVADYEEITDNLEGDQAYVIYLQNLAAAQGFKILAASDTDQTGWSCYDEGYCSTDTDPDPANSTFEAIACNGDGTYDNTPLADGLGAIADAYSNAMSVQEDCDDSGDTDHYAFWEAGIPAYVILEYDSADNPHFDDTGDDTMAHINIGLYAETARIQIAYQAQLAGLQP